MRIRLLTICSILLSPALLSAQEKNPPLSHHEQIYALERLYRDAYILKAEHINGYLYRDLYPRTKGHPFFLNENWMQGELLLRGKHYADLRLKYDLHKDQLLCHHIDEEGAHVIVLNKTWIKSFELQGHNFCKASECLPDMEDGQGFIERVVDGKASLYIRREKRLMKSSHSFSGEFAEFQQRYIRNKGELFIIRRKPSLMRALADKKREVKTFIRTQGIVLGSGDISDLKQVIQYYNSLP